MRALAFAAALGISACSHAGDPALAVRGSGPLAPGRTFALVSRQAATGFEAELAAHLEASGLRRVAETQAADYLVEAAFSSSASDLGAAERPAEQPRTLVEPKARRPWNLHRRNAYRLRVRVSGPDGAEIAAVSIDHAQWRGEDKGLASRMAATAAWALTTPGFRGG